MNNEEFELFEDERTVLTLDAWWTRHKYMLIYAAAEQEDIHTLSFYSAVDPSAILHALDELGQNHEWAGAVQRGVLHNVTKGLI